MQGSSSQSSARIPRAEVEAPPGAGALGKGVEVAGVTRRGRRHDVNEDQYFVAELERSMFVRCSGLPISGGVGGLDTPQGHVFMVADGVGGREGGRLASTVAVQEMATYVLTTMPWLPSDRDTPCAALEHGFESALRESQQRIRHEAREQGIDPRLGTTLTLAYVTRPYVHVVHAGDSRGYISRGEDLYRLTRDHTVAQALLDAAGDLDPGPVEARWGHVLDNVIGGSTDDLQVDMQRLELEEGDRLLLCTDGLTAYLDDAELRSRLHQGGSLEELAEQMVQSAFDRGGHDDITVVLAQF